MHDPGVRLRVGLICLVVVALIGLGGDRSLARTVDRPGAGAGLGFGRQREQRRLVVQVVAFGCRGQSVGSGVIAPEGRVLTNRHVVAGADYAEIRTNDGARIGARVEAVGADIDLAVLWVGPAGGDGPWPVGHLGPGTRLSVAGFPHARPFTVTSGPVTSRHPFDQVGMRGEAAFVDAEVDVGNSGGAAFDDAGQVAGIVFAREQHTGLAVVIDGDVAARFLAGEYRRGDPLACED